MNARTVKLINRYALNIVKFPPRTSKHAKKKHVKREWNNRPRNERYLTRKVMEEALANDK